MIKSRYSIFKKKLILFLLMLNANMLLATEGARSVFKFRYIELSLTQNYSSFRETRNLLFKGRAKILNELITKKIISGEIKALKFDIQLYDAVISRPQLIIRRYQKKCEVVISGYPSIQQLYSIVAYASAENKNLEYAGEGAEESINQFYIKYAKPVDQPKGAGLPLWSVSGLSLQYTADSLQYRFHNIPLSYPVKANPPLKIKDRFLVFTNDAILVIKHGKQIADVKIKPTNADFDCNVYTDWVNICDGGPQNWLYSYSYKKNKFFPNPKYVQ